jgi:hypothetical protein
MAEKGTLSTSQRRLLAALLSERTTRAAAEAAGVSERVAYRWLGEPAFRAELASRQDAVLAAVTSGLADDAQQARAVLRETMQSPDTPPGVKVRAALGIIDAALRLMELLTLAQRVGDLERRMEAQDATNPR